MIENQRVNANKQKCWCDSGVKRPLLSYRGKVWFWIIAGLTVFYSLAYAVIQELTR